MKVTLVVPVLNEIDGIKQIMPLIKPEWVDQLLFIDGQSSDGTLEYLKEKGFPYVVQKKKGMRHAYTEALSLMKGDVILTFSPDGNSIPELIPACIEKMKEGYDMVIVSRYKDQARSQDDDFLTGIGNWCFTKLIGLCHRFPYTDAMVIYRAYKKSLIHELDLDKDNSYEKEERLFKTVISWEPLLSIRCAKRRLKVADIPGDEPAREGGERKLQVWRRGAAYMFQVLREVFIWK